MTEGITPLELDALAALVEAGQATGDVTPETLGAFSTLDPVSLGMVLASLASRGLIRFRTVCPRSATIRITAAGLRAARP